MKDIVKVKTEKSDKAVKMYTKEKIDKLLKDKRDNLISDAIDLSDSDTSASSRAVKTVNDKVVENTNKMGSFSGLNTTEKGSLVGAINENEGRLDSLENEISININTKTTTLTNIIPTQYITAKQNCGADIEVDGELMIQLLDNRDDFANWITKEFTVEDGAQVYTASGSNIRGVCPTNLKNETIYTAIVKVVHNNLNGSFIYVKNQDGMNEDGDKTISSGQIGIFKTSFTTGTITINQLSQLVGEEVTTGFIKAKTIILEGDYTNKDNTWFEPLFNMYGAKPLFNPTVEVCENLFDKNSTPIAYYPSHSDVDYEVTDTGIKVFTLTSGTYRRIRFEFIGKPYTEYTIACDVKKVSGAAHKYAGNIYVSDIPNPVILSPSENEENFTTGYDGKGLVTFYVTNDDSEDGKINFNNIRITEGSNSITNEPYKGGLMIFPTELAKIGNETTGIGKNLFNCDQEVIYINDDYTNGTYSDGQLNTTDKFLGVIPIKVDPNTTYYFSAEGVGARRIYELSAYPTDWPADDPNYIRRLVSSSSNTSFTTSADTQYVCAGFYIDVAVTQPNTITNIQLEEGTKQTKYEPYHTTIVLNGYQDKLTYKDGVAKVDRQIKHMIMDNMLDWVFSAHYVGFKAIKAPLSGFIPYSEICTKYDGKVLKKSSACDNADLSYLDAGHLYITVAGSDSGWGDEYSPTTDEIKAYFNGWVMYNSDTLDLYNGTGNKAWTKRYVGVGTPYTASFGSIVESGTSTSVLPTTVINAEYTPYQLYYALQEPIQEEIQPIILGDGVNLVEGQNILTVESGIVWENQTPYFREDNSKYYIGYDNPLSSSYSALTFKSNKIIAIYKEIVEEGKKVKTNDTSNWTIIADEYDNGWAYSTEIDSQADYYVLYEVLQEDYNCQIQEVKISYEDNIRGAVNEVIEEVANLKQNISELYALVEDLMGV